MLRRNYRRAAPILDAAYRLIRFNDPDRLEVAAGIGKRLVAERGASAGRPPRDVRDRRRGGGLDRRRDRPPDRAPARGPATSRILVRANAAADPILRSLNLAGIPWRFSGTCGPLRPAGGPAACSRSCGRSRTSASSVDVYALAASELYGLGGEDLSRS